MIDYRIKYDDGNKMYESYRLNNRLHREGGPAFITYSGNGNKYLEEYYINGKCHREDGPAEIQYDNDGSIILEAYWLNGKNYTDKNIIANWKDFCKMQVFT